MFKRWSRTALLAALVTAAAAFAVHAEAPQPSEAEMAAQVKALVDGLHFQTGEIGVPEAQAHFRLGSQFRYLGKEDSRKVLEQLWGNPPDDTILGMVVPASTPLTGNDSWAVVVTYADDGYVSDEDAAKTDYDDLLKQIKQETEDGNAERKKAGYGAVHMIGWAVPPRYDASAKKLYWAKEAAFEGEDQHTLNYDVRVLGRRGYLSLNAVAGMPQLSQVQAGMQQLLPMAEFDQGARYADYDSSTDKLAGYGLAALIGGGIAAKTGLLAKLGVLLLAAKKFIVFIVIGIAAFVRKLFGGKGGNDRQGTVQ